MERSIPDIGWVGQNGTHKALHRFARLCAVLT
nr:MAG TPA_asm: hypothetical protein [Caudoviricetes sp.]